MAIAMILGVSASSAGIMKTYNATQSEAFVGIGYLATKKGATTEGGAAVSTAGIIGGAIQGACWGSAFGPGVGTAVGAVVGL